jgi:hypothetical protein
MCSTAHIRPNRPPEPTARDQTHHVHHRCARVPPDRTTGVPQRTRPGRSWLRSSKQLSARRAAANRTVTTVPVRIARIRLSKANRASNLPEVPLLVSGRGGCVETMTDKEKSGDDPEHEKCGVHCLPPIGLFAGALTCHLVVLTTMSPRLLPSHQPVASRSGESCLASRGCGEPCPRRFLRVTSLTDRRSRRRASRSRSAFVLRSAHLDGPCWVQRLGVRGSPTAR